MSKKLFLQIFSIGILTIFLFSGFLTQDDPAWAVTPLKLDPSNVLSEHNTYLPLIMTPIQLPIFGAETSRGGVYHIQKAQEANLYWLRYGVFNWNEIEPVRTDPPTYHWESVDENALLEASQRGLTVIAIIKYTPAWAQKIPGVACGPVAEDALDAFAEFVQALVKRYGVAPYDVEYWEIGNEPDVDPSLVPPDHPFGCWGDKNDEFYGGGYYAQMLKHVYPAIITENPDAKLLNGGLLLDCDPTNDDACLPGKFFEGILANQGANYFDIVSFHTWPSYYGTLFWEEHDYNWGKRGGIVLGKIDFLREIMGKYGVDKPIIQTEGALGCPPGLPLDYNPLQVVLGFQGGKMPDYNPFCNPPVDAYYEAQADYVVWLYVRNWAQGLLGTSWYTLEGPSWFNAGLFNLDKTPRPAYHALKFLTEELSSSDYVRVVPDPNLRVYEFIASEKRIWVLWSPDEHEYPITIPGNTQNIYDKYGDTISPQGGQITVKSPIYIEMTK